MENKVLAKIIALSRTDGYFVFFRSYKDLKLNCLYFLLLKI